MLMTVQNKVTIGKHTNSIQLDIVNKGYAWTHC